jgi:hypothetical protein
MNIPKKKEDAVKTLMANYSIWKCLADLYTGDCEDDVADVKELDHVRLVSRRVVFAVGGAVFPPEEVAYFTRRFGSTRPWLRVHLDGAQTTCIVCEKHC